MLHRQALASTDVSGGATDCISSCYYVKTVHYQHETYAEIKNTSTLNSGNACHYSVQNLLSSRLT
jgi:hypothetical protein